MQPFYFTNLAATQMMVGMRMMCVLCAVRSTHGTRQHNIVANVQKIIVLAHTLLGTKLVMRHNTLHNSFVVHFGSADLVLAQQRCLEIKWFRRVAIFCCALGLL